MGVRTIEDLYRLPDGDLEVLGLADEDIFSFRAEL